jgi:hypothetical protein
LQFVEQAIGNINRIADPEFDVGSDLVVAAAARVQFAAEIAQLFDQSAFEVRVDVFEFRRERELATVDAGDNAVEG